MSSHRSRLVSGGGRIVEVEAARVAGWFDRFARHHGGVRHTELAEDEVLTLAEDGVSARVAVPFAPMAPLAGEPFGNRPGLAIGALAAHLTRPRTIGVVLVRLGGHSIGVVESGQVVRSTTDRRPVHGRNKAGGWSQRRFARRREDQARLALRAAADDAVRVLVSDVARLDAVVLGGDRRALDVLRADPRLAEVLALAQPRVLEVMRPSRDVLDEAAVRACGVEIVVRERSSESGP